MGQADERLKIIFYLQCNTHSIRVRMQVLRCKLTNTYLFHRSLAQIAISSPYLSKTAQVLIGTP